MTIEPRVSPSAEERYLSDTPHTRPSIVPRTRSAPSPQSRVSEGVVVEFISHWTTIDLPVDMLILDVPNAIPIIMYAPNLVQEVIRMSEGSTVKRWSDTALEELTEATLLL